jgi:hypothetical protein
VVLSTAVGTTSAGLLETTTRSVLGQGPLAALAGLAMVGGWYSCSPGLGRRVAIAFPLAFLLFANPYLAAGIAEHVTGPQTYWRVFWLVPVPLLLAALLTAPLRRTGSVPPHRRLVATTIFVLVVLALVPRRYVLGRANGTRFAPLHLKVHEGAYRAAAALAARVPPGSTVVAPSRVASWLATFRDRSYPLVVRPAYLTRFGAWLGSAEVSRRLAMTEAVSRRKGRPQLTAFATGLTTYDVRGVCLESRVRSRAELAAVLARGSFDLVERHGRFELWVRR